MGLILLGEHRRPERIHRDPQIYEGQWFQVMQDPEGHEFCIAKEWVPELL